VFEHCPWASQEHSYRHQFELPTQVSWTFVVPEYMTRYGEKLKVVGSLGPLGYWNLDEAPDMDWHPGHRWTFNTVLPIGTDFEFKVRQQCGLALSRGLAQHWPMCWRFALDSLAL
jgi:hypothetical protein